MTERELRKKIVEITISTVWKDSYGDEAVIDRVAAEQLADALIAAGIGDLKEHRIFAGKDGSIKQLYSGEEVEKIVKERKELKDELRSKVEYIHEQDEVIKEYKHRAARAERALENEIKNRINITGDVENLVYAYYGRAIYQAEKELAEERKDD